MNSDDEKFKFVLIFQDFKNRNPELVLELSWANSKSLGPLLHLSKYYKKLPACLVSECHDLFYLLSSIGMKEMPYIIPHNVWTNDIFFSFINNIDKVYSQNKPNGSLKQFSVNAIKDKLSPIINIIEPISGNLNGGEIYIDSIGKKFINGKAFYKYLHSYMNIPINSTSPYFLSDKNIWMKRLIEEEKSVIQELDDYIDMLPGDCSVKIKNAHIQEIVQSPKLRWSIYQHKHVDSSKISFSSQPSKIKWLELSSLNTENYEQLIDAFLKSRQYIKIENNLFFFSTENISNDIDIISSGLVSNKDTTSFLLDAHKKLDDFKKNTCVPSSSFSGLLLNFQTTGLQWLTNLKKNSFGGILADEMGLGKTVQIIAFLSNEISVKPSLIIAPASVVSNWQAEIERFLPHYANLIFMSIDDFVVRKEGILIVSYERARNNIEAIRSIEFENMIIDEAQKIKNAQILTHQTLKKIRANFKIILTGTPIENSIQELWNHVSFVNPDLTGAFEKIETRFSDFKTSSKGAIISRRLLAPFILSRKKKDVYKDLPELYEEVYFCKMDDEQLFLYNEIHKMLQEAIQSGLSGRINSLMLEGLLRLRQCCSSPSLLPAQINVNDVKKSKKIDTALELIEEIAEINKKVILFSQFMGTLDIIESLLEKKNYGYCRLDGHSKDRSAIINKFNKDDNKVVFLGSLMAGGVGINLTSAEYVILMEPWWNPAVEAQAFSRAHRVGQHNKVFVYKLICLDTIELKMLDLIEKKKKIAQEIVGEGVAITPKEILNLLR